MDLWSFSYRILPLCRAGFDDEADLYGATETKPPFAFAANK
jgi:hypothetical protein